MGHTISKGRTVFSMAAAAAMLSSVAANINPLKAGAAEFVAKMLFGAGNPPSGMGFSRGRPRGQRLEEIGEGRMQVRDYSRYRYPAYMVDTPKHLRENGVSSAHNAPRAVMERKMLAARRAEAPSGLELKLEAPIQEAAKPKKPRATARKAAKPEDNGPAPAKAPRKPRAKKAVAVD